MGKLIKIEKDSVLDSLHYYLVTTEDFKAGSLFIGIDAQNKLISFYIDKNFEKPLKVVNLNNPHEKISIPEIDPRLMWPAIGQAKKAIENNSFPKRIDYCA